MNSQTTEPIERRQLVHVYSPKQEKKTPRGCRSCLLIVLSILALGLMIIGVYFLAPLRTNLLVLGIDRAPEDTALGRSDTIILVSINPLKPDVKMLSIPRDLWVSIPGVGENRINTAHFYAEANETGSGPVAAMETVNQNFGLSVQYYLRLRFDAFERIVNALGGIDIQLSKDMGGLTAGNHHLDGAQALAFVRDRKGSDDFFRMEQGQLMIKAIIRQVISPASWPNLPAVSGVVFDSIDTNLPFWRWPRLGLALLRGSFSGMDSRTIEREMTTPYTTDGGAQVLLPNWELINPLVEEMFGR